VDNKIRLGTVAVNRHTLSYEEGYLLGYMEGCRIGRIETLRKILLHYLHTKGKEQSIVPDKKLIQKINRETDIEFLLSMASKGFSYEWLLHMGASSKQDEPGKYAGLFGEGFKVASLCALRDYNWKIKMHSRDWSLEVCTLSTTVDGKPLKQLAYNVTEGCPHSTETILTIQPFSQEDADLLEEIVLGFYFPENPLFGSCIFENKYVAVYERSKQQKPASMPTGLELHGEGIVYISFQARGGFDIPIVICNHKFETKSRDRHEIYLGTILEILIDTVDYIDAKTSCYLLEKFEKYWYDYPHAKRDVDSWYSLIRKLIRKIAFYDSEIAKDFFKRHSHLVVCEHPVNLYMRNQKTQALTWKRLYLPNARLVQDGFSLLGYKSIVYLCEKAGGFNVLREPNINERHLIKILEDAGKVIFAGLLIFT